MRWGISRPGRTDARFIIRAFTQPKDHLMVSEISPFGRDDRFIKHR